MVLSESVIVKNNGVAGWPAGWRLETEERPGVQGSQEINGVGV